MGLPRRSWPAALLAALALAGCLAPAAVEPAAAPVVGIAGAVSAERLPVPEVDFTTAIDGDHGGAPELHAVPALHDHGHGLDLVGHTPLTEGGLELGGADLGFTAMDTWGSYACVTHFLSGGASIVDLTDPAAPKVLAVLDTGMVNSDCQFTDDGVYLVLAAFLGARDVPTLPVPLVPPGTPAANGVAVYDVTDKAAPALLLFSGVGGGDGAIGGNYHNVFTAQIHGEHYIFPAFGGAVLRLDAQARALEEVGQLDFTVHDLWVGLHPVTGKWVLITGHSSGGTAIFDVEDPARPQLLGVWEAHDGLEGWHRQWPLAQLVDGRALMLVAGETGGGGTLPYTVLDFTDPTAIEELGTWEVPGKPVNTGPNFFTFSPHEFETWDGYVATGNYHAGVWLLDIGSPERARSPATLGYYLPAELPGPPGTANKPFAFNPDVWGAYFDERGYVLTADWYSGLYVLRFGATKG